jgi:predicted DNA-binding transcriptional regulator AlpA
VLNAVRMASTSSPIEQSNPESMRLLNSQDVGDMLGMDARTVRRMALAGRFPRVEFGHRTVRFRLADVLDFIEASTTNEERQAGSPDALQVSARQGRHASG